jgi:ribosomal protein L37AE/L43A
MSGVWRAVLCLTMPKRLTFRNGEIVDVETETCPECGSTDLEHDPEVTTCTDCGAYWER